MQTVIVPVDFSETSLNAARYAVQLLTGHYGVNMILHHVYEKDAQLGEVTQKLEDLKNELMELGIVKTQLLAEKGDDFIEELEKLARHRDAELIIMGVAGKSAIAQSIMGSNTLKMVKKKVCPVLIIPEDARYHDVKNVMLTTDLEDVTSSTPSVPIRKILKTFKPHLFVMNVDNTHYVSLTEEAQAEKAKLKEMFKDFKPEFFFLGLNDVEEGINQFAQDKKIDFIIIIHKEQNLFSKLFVKSRTKKLIYQSQTPLLVIHE